MSENNPIRIFVCHNFIEEDEYLRVFEFLESQERFFYVNNNKPENAPQSGTMEAIKDELILQIKESEVVILLASLYRSRANCFPIKWLLPKPTKYR